MRKFDIKSFVAGIIMGSVGITTVFAAGVLSASPSQANITLNGSPLPLSKPLLSVTTDKEQDASLYAPLDELLESLGYAVYYDSTKNTVDLISSHGGLQQAAAGTVLEGNVVIDLASHPGQANIAESGSFQAEGSQVLTLAITSDIKGGSADFFLFDPSGKEQRITIGSEDMIKEIPLEKGLWQYNCSGLFKDGGNIKIVGTVK